MNLLACQELTERHHCDIVLLESGGDNLAADFSRELADYTVYVIDTAGGDKVPRKGGPGTSSMCILMYIHSICNICTIWAYSICMYTIKVGLTCICVGITQSDLLVINKIDLADAIGASLETMRRDAALMRGDGPTVFAQVKHGPGVEEIVSLIEADFRASVISEQLLDQPVNKK